MSSNKNNDRAVRALMKQRMFAHNYGMVKVGNNYHKQVLANNRFAQKLRDTAQSGHDHYADWIDDMKQTWIIDGEWSAYHSATAATKGWGLTQVQGMWQITAVNSDLFKDDNAAREHVLACEANPEHEEFTLALIAVNAIMVGNIRG